MFDCTQDWCKFWRKTGLCFQKWKWGICQIFTRALEGLKIGTLITYFCLKLRMYELKIYSGIMCHDNQEWCKNWRRIDLPVQNWHEEFRQNSSNLPFNGLFLTKVYNVWAKKCIEELCLIALNIDAKFEGKMTCAFKTDMRNLANFHQSMFETPKIGILRGSFYRKSKLSLKFTGEFCVMTMKSDAKFEEELTCQFKSDIEDMTNFNPSTRKSQKFAL